MGVLRSISLLLIVRGCLGGSLSVVMIARHLATEGLFETFARAGFACTILICSKLGWRRYSLLLRGHISSVVSVTTMKRFVSVRMARASHMRRSSMSCLLLGKRMH